MERDDAQWFAIWTRSRHEQVVREQLEQKRVDAFLPTITRWSRWKDTSSRASGCWWAASCSTTRVR